MRWAFRVEITNLIFPPWSRKLPLNTALSLLKSSHEGYYQSSCLFESHIKPENEAYSSSSTHYTQSQQQVHNYVQRPSARKLDDNDSTVKLEFWAVITANADSHQKAKDWHSWCMLLNSQWTHARTRSRQSASLHSDRTSWGIPMPHDSRMRTGPANMNTKNKPTFTKQPFYVHPLSRTTWVSWKQKQSIFSSLNVSTVLFRVLGGLEQETISDALTKHSHHCTRQYSSTVFPFTADQSAFLSDPYISHIWLTPVFKDLLGLLQD